MAGRWRSGGGYRNMGVTMPGGPQGGKFGIVNDGSGFRRGFTGGPPLGSATGNPMDLLMNDPTPLAPAAPKKKRKSRAKPKSEKRSVWETLPAQFD